KIYGRQDLTVAISLSEQARMEHKAGRWSMAWEHLKQARSIFAELYGERHWRTKDADVAVNESAGLMSEFPDTRNRIREARARPFKATLLLQKGHCFNALELAQADEAAIDFFVNGRRYSIFAANQVCLAAIYRALGRFSEAEQRQRRAVDI